MKKNLFISLVSFMIVSILGIIILQGYWIFSAWNDKEKELYDKKKTDPPQPFTDMRRCDKHRIGWTSKKDKKKNVGFSVGTFH